MIAKIRQCLISNFVHNATKNIMIFKIERYHAQPNACKECGPKLIYVGNKQDEDELENAINDLKEGKIVAIKGIGGIHLACDANNKQAVLRLRKRKQREAKPFAIMAKDIQTAKELVDISSVEESFLTSKERPIRTMQKESSKFIHRTIRKQRIRNLFTI